MRALAKFLQILRYHRKQYLIVFFWRRFATPSGSNQENPFFRQLVVDSHSNAFFVL